MEGLTSFGSLISAFLPPRFLIPLFVSVEPFHRRSPVPYGSGTSDRNFHLVEKSQSYTQEEDLPSSGAPAISCLSSWS